MKQLHCVLGPARKINLLNVLPDCHQCASEDKLHSRKIPFCWGDSIPGQALKCFGHGDRTSDSDQTGVWTSMVHVTFRSGPAPASGLIFISEHCYLLDR